MIIQVSLKSGKNNEYFTWRPIYILITPRLVLLRMRNVSQKLVKKQIFYVQLLFASRDNVEKYCTARQATDDNNTAHAHCMLDTQGYKHTLRTCNKYCFSIATMVEQTPLIVTLYVRCLFC